MRALDESCKKQIAGPFAASSTLTCPSTAADALRKLGKRLGDMNAGGVPLTDFAHLLAGLYREDVWAARGPGSWEVFLVGERLRFEDLVTGLDLVSMEALIRDAACALTAAGLPQRAAGSVLGRSAMSVSRYVKAVGRATSVTAVASAGGCETQSARKFAEAVVNDLLQEAAAAPPVPASALILAATPVEELSGLIGEFAEGLGGGAALGDKGGILLRRLVRDLETATSRLRELGMEQGVLA